MSGDMIYPKRKHWLTTKQKQSFKLSGLQRLSDDCFFEAKKMVSGDDLFPLACFQLSQYWRHFFAPSADSKTPIDRDSRMDDKGVEGCSRRVRLYIGVENPTDLSFGLSEDR